MADRAEAAGQPGPTGGDVNVLVLGMHRTGTSAVAGALRAAGLYAGRDDALVGRLAENPDGFVERPDVVDLDERLLDAVGWTWDTPDPAPLSQPPALDSLVEAGRELVASRLAPGGTWLLKDPRMSLLLPWWRRILLDRFVAVVPLREPAETAWSLSVRDGFSMELGMSLCAAYLRHLAAGLEGLPVVAVDYGALTDEPTQVVAELLDALRRLGVSGSLDVEAATAAVRPTLRRPTEPTIQQSAASDSIRAVYDAWRNGPLAVHERFELHPPAASSWEAALLLAHRVGRQRQRKAELNEGQLLELEGVRRQLDATEARLVAIEDERDALRAAVRAERDQRAAEHAAHHRLDTGIEELRAELVRMRRDAAETSAQHAPRYGHHRPPSRRPGRLARSARRNALRLAARVMPGAVLARLWHNPLFDAEWYVQQDPDLTRARSNAEQHFRRHGVREGRQPNELFDTDWYLARYPDVARSGLNPLDHYLLFGAAEGRDPSMQFSTGWYLAQNPDVAQMGMNPLLHYLRYGRSEGRLARAPERPAEPGASEPATTSPGLSIGGRTVKLLAFYLPQFHTVLENDRWWGPGFSDWFQIARSRPLYDGHLQPRLPAQLGFYDLLLPEVRRAQAELAAAHGIHGFCYYFYWFNGRRILDRPLAEVLASGEPRFPFLICWANENWTRRWDGLESEILLTQDYEPEWHRRFINDVIPILRDPRYVRYEGKPVLVVYRVREIPNVKEAVAAWREECRAAGIGEIHLAAVRFWDVIDVTQFGFDAAVDFPPHHVAVRTLTESLTGRVPGFRGLAYDYGHVVRENLRTMGHGYESPAHRGLMLAWDNTPRRGPAAHIAHGATPELYEEWLRGTIEQEMAHNPSDESLIFINAWNEWAEGANLEPDTVFGDGFLQATRRVTEVLAASATARR